MALKVIGAGVGRTGTTSLCAALEILLRGRCYHMHEVFPRPQDIPHWHNAALGQMPDWNAFLSEYVAAVDWPASAYWQELAAANPQALIVLSTRRDAETWWRSASNTIFPASVEAQPGLWRSMIFAMLEDRFTDEIQDAEKSMAAYEAHNARVRQYAPAARLLEWQAEDGWGPLCAALKLPVPQEPFPIANTTEQFHERAAQMAAEAAKNRSGKP